MSHLRLTKVQLNITGKIVLKKSCTEISKEYFIPSYLIIQNIKLALNHQLIILLT